MKIGRRRQHKWQPKQWETGDLTAWVEIDTDSESDQKELEASGAEGWHDFIDKFLDDALDEDIRRAVESSENQTHLTKYYPDQE